MYSSRNTRLLLHKCKCILRNQNCIKPSLARGIHTEVKAFNRMLSRNPKSVLTRISLLKRNFNSSHLRLDAPKDKGNNPKKGPTSMETFIAYCAFPITAFILYQSFIKSQNSEQSNTNSHIRVSWNEFVRTMLAKGEVHELTVLPNHNLVQITLFQDAIIEGQPRGQYLYSMVIPEISQFEDRLIDVEKQLGIKPGHGVSVVYKRIDKVVYLIASLLVLAALYAARKHIVSMDGPVSSLFRFREAKYTLIDPHMPGTGNGIKFSDVAGSHEAKQEIKEFVTFLKSPDVYKKLGAKVPKGALLLGPPGCGKTLLAKAVSTEGNVPFLAMNGPEFIEMIGGLGAARVRDLFTQAKKKAPCIVYIDEIDAIGRKRAEGKNISGTQSEGEQTLNQLLVEMDGILTKEGVIVLASTNRLSVLDKALLRPGRFDRHIIMDLPNLEERTEIFELHLAKIILENTPKFYSRWMASLTLGFTGADIANVCNEAAISAGRNKKKKIDASDLEYAIERLMCGSEKKTNVISQEEKRIIAYHESGHALVGWLLKYTDVLLKVTIIPRTSSVLGFAQYSPKEQKLYSQEELCEKMCMAFGGRVAEALTFNKVTTGAQNDLETITTMAYAQVRTMGFSERVGQVSFPDNESGDGGRRPYSKMLANVIDQEVHRIIYECYKKTEVLLSENKDKLKTLAEALLKRETLSYDDVVELLGPPAHQNKNLIEPLQFENQMKNWKEMDKIP